MSISVFHELSLLQKRGANLSGGKFLDAKELLQINEPCLYIEVAVLVM